MTTFNIQKATKKQAKLRLAIIGVSGSGKTYTSLKFATQFGKVCVIDTERGSASKYADEFNFDVIELDSYSPDSFSNAIRYIESLKKYDAIVIDSLSHAWSGKDGALELVDKAARRSQSNNSYAAWRDVTPLHNQMIDSIVSSKLHVFVTMRAKQDYSMERDEKTGKTTVRKVGLAPIQRDGVEYEFDLVADMTLDNDFIVSKTRCKDLHGKIFNKPGTDVSSILLKWLDGEPVPEPASAPVDFLEAETPSSAFSLTTAMKQIENCNTIDELEKSFKVLIESFSKGSADYKSFVTAVKNRKTQIQQETEVA